MIKLIINLILGLFIFAVFPKEIGNSDRPLFVNPQERYCIYEALWHEARGESKEGIRAVVSVIQNRVYSAKYPTTYCQVIRQHKQFSYYHQHKNKGLSLVPRPTMLQNDLANYMQSLADQALSGKLVRNVPDDALWYHATYVKPKWSKQLNHVKTIGKHKFYSAKDQ